MKNAFVFVGVLAASAALFATDRSKPNGEKVADYFQNETPTQTNVAISPVEPGRRPASVDSVEDPRLDHAEKYSP